MQLSEETSFFLWSTAQYLEAAIERKAFVSRAELEVISSKATEVLDKEAKTNPQDSNAVGSKIRVSEVFSEAG